MKRAILFVFCLTWFSTGPLYSQNFSKDSSAAKEYVKKAIAYWKKNGKEASLKEFSDMKGHFVHGEFYLFVHGFSHPDECINLARGDGNTALIGKNLWSVQDQTGHYFYQDIVKVAQTKEGCGWVDYQRTNPATGKIESKHSYIEKVPGENILIGCGFYK